MVTRLEDLSGCATKDDDEEDEDEDVDEVDAVDEQLLLQNVALTADFG